MKINFKLLCLASALIGSAALSTTALAQIGGVNLQPSYTNGGNVDIGWGLMKAQTKIKAVRIEIDTGAFGFNLDAHSRIIKEAIDQANITKVVITYHDKSCLGCDDATKLQNGARFFVNNRTKLYLGNPKIRINLFNEWGSHNISSTNWANQINAAVKIIRDAGISDRLIADVPGLGQGAIRGANGIKQVTDTRVVPSMHLYSTCYDAGAKVDSELIAAGLTAADKDDGWGRCKTKYMQALVRSGRGFFMGEFGTRQAGDKISEAFYKDIITAGKSYGDIYAWAWNGDGGDMNMASPTFQPYVVNSPKTYSKSGYFNEVYAFLP